MMRWDDQVQGSTEQKEWRQRLISGGSMSPSSPVPSSNYSYYTRGLTHGVPSGFAAEDKKLAKMGISGGDFKKVFTNGYHKESVNEMRIKDE